MQTQVPSKAANFAHPQRNVAALGIEPGMQVVDFGSGSGAYVLAIAERLEGLGNVYAIDIQQDLLRRISNEAKKNDFKNVEVICADLETPNASKLSAGIADVVLASNILFQISDKHILISEARRIVRPKGRFVVIDWSDSFKGMGPTSEQVVQKNEVLKLASASGFELIKEFEAGAHHYGLIFRPSDVSQ